MLDIPYLRDGDKDGIKMEKIYKNKMTMFDMMKGLAIFIVVLWHSYDFFFGAPDLIWGRIPIYSVWPALMPVFYIANGYWYKPKDNKVYVKAQAKSLLKPFFFVGIMAAGLAGVKNYILYHSKRSALKGFSCIFLGFVTGSSEDVFFHIAGKEVHLCNLGPTWFIFTLFASGIILNYIMTNDKIKHKTAVIIGLAVIGFAVERVYWTPMCISAITEAVLSIYCGYRLKESKLLLLNWDKKMYTKVVGLAIFGYVAAVLVMTFYDPTSYFVRVIPGLPEAMLLIRFGLRCEPKHNIVFDGLRKLGRYSMWIYLVHSIEVLAINWHFISDVSFFSNHHYLGVLAVFGARSCFIAVGVFAISKVDSFMIRRYKHGIF